MHRFVLLGVVGCAAAPPPTITTSAATLAITPDTPTSRRVLPSSLSAYVQRDVGAWQLVLADAPPGTDCRTVGPGPGTLTFFVPTMPPPFGGPADGSIAQAIDVATTAGPTPHAGLDLAVATRETVGALFFFQTSTGFSGRFDATTTSGDDLLHVTGAFDAPICD